MKNWFLVLFFLIQAAWAEASTALKVSPVDRPQGEYLSEFFGHVKVNLSEIRGWSISNTGSTELNFEKIVIRGAMFNAQSNCPKVLLPQSQCLLRVQFHPWVEGFQAGEVDMLFNEGGNIYIDLSGYGDR